MKTRYLVIRIIIIILILIAFIIANNDETRIVINAYNVENSGFDTLDIIFAIKYSERYFNSYGINVKFLTNVFEIKNETITGFELKDINLHSTEYIEEASNDPQGEILYLRQIIQLFQADGGPINMIFVNHINSYIGISDQEFNTIGIGFYDDDASFYNNGKKLDIIVTHELAHQFGLLDTINTYRDPFNLMWNVESTREGHDLRPEQIYEIKKGLSEWK